MKAGRPKKIRLVQRKPITSQFSPRGRIGRPDHVDLELDHYEALRLSDFIGLNQKEAAKSMNISQQTFSRVLKQARKALTEGIALGKIINIKTREKGSKTKKDSPKTPENPS